MDTHIYLVYQIFNRPIDSGILKLMMVRREKAQDVTVQFAIKEKGTDKELCPKNHIPIKTQANVMLSRASLPASYMPVEIAVVGYSNTEKKIHV